MRLKVINVVGARPNFMKIAPIIDAMNRKSEYFDHTLVHTGQHYDEKMSKAFFEDLGMPRPDINLEIGSGSHAEQTAGVMMAFEKVCLECEPDLVIVVGDVNSTMACAITAKKLGIKVAHVEAGLRSFDMGMPEEINRLCTDAVSDYLFTTDHYANENLRSEGIAEENIVFVGNVMIDTLLRHRETAAKLSLAKDLGLEHGNYALVTLHRPSNVDEEAVLREILEALFEIGKDIPVVFPVHPRTRKQIEDFNLQQYVSKNDEQRGVRLIDPLGYLDFLHLMINAGLVLTDSGGIQEETTMLGMPCITLRENTERPVTCDQGTNCLVSRSKDAIIEAVRNASDADYANSKVPDRWDGKAADRIVDWLVDNVVR